MGCRGRQPLQMIPYMYGFTRADNIRHYRYNNAKSAHNTAEVRCMEKGGLLPVLDSSIQKIRSVSGGSSDVLMRAAVL